MEAEQQTQEPITINENKHVKKRKGKKFGALFLVLLLLAGTGSGVFYWQQQDIKKLKNENQQLTSKLASKVGDNQKPSEDEAQTVYKAEVGKFTLTLPHKYVVLEENDGGGEGGPSTSLKIGERTDVEGVFTTQIFSTVTIYAYPLQDRSSFRQEIDGILEGGLPQKLPSVTIDGTTAEVYHTEGLGNPKDLFFTHNNLFYRISMDHDHEPTSTQLNEIIKGFKFDN